MLDTNYITSLLQQIVDAEFSTSVERKIFNHGKNLNLRCPYCHEGRTKTKKRGNLYFDKMIYVCFRCGKKTTLDRMLKDFSLTIDPQKKLELINYLNEQISYQDVEDDIFDHKFDKLIDLGEIERIFNDSQHVITDFKPVADNSKVYQYLISRAISKNLQKNIWEGKYWTSSDRWEPVIIILNRRGEKVLGAQIRNLKIGKARLFKIYNFETLYKWVKDVEEVTDIDISELVIYNKLSYYFNILNINFSERITIFEGYLDSLFYPNSLGVIGVNTDLRFIETNNLDIQYFYDNDEVGHKNAETKIREGRRVFLWKKLFEDIVNQKKSDDPYNLMWRINKVKDLNKLAELVQEPYSKLNLENYFSLDALDLRWIPKRERKLFKKF
jgi:hypothetical protein